MNYIKQLKKDGHLAVDFYLTKSCNKSCWYCTAWTKEMRNLTVDMDFLRSLLNHLSSHKVRICLLGGEPALIHNLEEVINEIKKHKTLVPQVMSNGLIRNRYPWVLDDPSIIYMEHLVLDFHEDRIEKLSKHDFLPENGNNNFNAIIKTPGYFLYRDSHDLSKIDHANTQFKEFNGRAPGFEHLLNRPEQAPEVDRMICAAFPSVPVVDFELQKIRHCSKKVINGSRTFDVTKENIDKMFNFELFEYESYCETCTETISRRPKWQREQVLKKIGFIRN